MLILKLQRYLVRKRTGVREFVKRLKQTDYVGPLPQAFAMTANAAIVAVAPTSADSLVFKNANKQAAESVALRACDAYAEVELVVDMCLFPLRLRIGPPCVPPPPPSRENKHIRRLPKGRCTKTWRRSWRWLLLQMEFAAYL